MNRPASFAAALALVVLAGAAAAAPGTPANTPAAQAGGSATQEPSVELRELHPPVNLQLGGGQQTVTLSGMNNGAETFVGIITVTPIDCPIFAGSVNTVYTLPGIQQFSKPLVVLEAKPGMEVNQLVICNLRYTAKTKDGHAVGMGNEVTVPCQIVAAK